MNREDILQKARILAQAYGHKLERHVVYTQGVAIEARLRLARLDPEYPDPKPEISTIVAPYLENPDQTFDDSDGTANYAGINWADSIPEDPRAAQLLIATAQRFLHNGEHGMSEPLDPDFRVEDVFFSATILQRATAITAQSKYADIAAQFLIQAAHKLQQQNGLFWHCMSSPFFWGRGNGFAALGFAEALKTASPDFKSQLIEIHTKHLKALQKHQDPNTGMWRQVTDQPDSYLEHSCTSMIGIAIATGIANGWLPKDQWIETLQKAWQGTSERISPNAHIHQVCVGTGPLPDIQEYLNRPYSTEQDERGGAMALWFATQTLEAIA